MNNVLTNRHDLFILFDVTNGNPNGDPDAGNMPRIEPNTNRGLISDVCIKRKIRNYVMEFPPASSNGSSNKFDIQIQQGVVIERQLTEAIQSASNDESLKGCCEPEKVKNWLCRQFYDIRTFGGVLSTGQDIMRGSAYGQVRGPVQFTFSQSYDPITPLEVSITRCAVTKESDAAKERTMGDKHIVPYGLYMAKGYVSPAFAQNTGFTQQDFDLLIEALTHMFEHDRSAARGEMVVRALYDFEHVGTQGDKNPDQNKREAKLGCAPAHKLFETVHVQLTEGKTFPSGFDDYELTCAFQEADFPGVKLNQHL
ncbi:MAG: type I-C CRISPR-associated protein Cas7/Csd2 [Candidatus Omnitrophica bacterium]|nr:type I-C CRISPR-associated protein Cas7/Csd2 [Candidatus Omnitrophota bacterium]